MNGQNAQQHRTIPRHPRMRQYDREERKHILGYELNMDMLANTTPIPIVSIDDFCEYIGVCHSPCSRKEAQSCSDYPIIYEEWRKIHKPNGR